ncbi:unnamed protein product [Trichobilharzia regenti]|nr:unnamed protein product [Trichobilharzia regenti]
MTLPTQTNIPQFQLGRCVCLQRLPPVMKVAKVLQTFLPSKKKRVDRVDVSSYALSRWTPYLLDIMEVSLFRVFSKVCRIVLSCIKFHSNKVTQ